jgi:hypothetical protein
MSFYAAEPIAEIEDQKLVLVSPSCLFSAHPQQRVDHNEIHSEYGHIEF